jgi:hypothetical protein
MERIDKKKLPVGLERKQTLQRQETINRVLRAVTDLKNEGRKVTISALIEFTGLSRSTFSKKHIRELLVEHGYSSEDAVLSKSSSKRKRKGEMGDKDQLIADLKTKNTNLENECELLRGRLFLMMQRLQEE